MLPSLPIRYGKNSPKECQIRWRSRKGGRPSEPILGVGLAPGSAREGDPDSLPRERRHVRSATVFMVFRASRPRWVRCRVSLCEGFRLARVVHPVKDVLVPVERA